MVLEDERDSDWKAISHGGWFYHVLMKRDGSLWEIRLDPDQTESTGTAASPKKLEIPGSVIAFDTGGGKPFGVAINDLGEVWTWGKGLGVHTKPNSTLQTLSGLAGRLGWRVDWGASQAVVREKPWRLPLEE